MEMKKVIQIVILCVAGGAAGFLLLKPSENASQSEAEALRHFVCAGEEGCGHGFSRSVSEIAGLKQGEYNSCPECEGRLLIGAIVCESCNTYNQLGANSTVPENCSNCGVSFRD